MKKILKIPLRRIPRRPPPAESLRAKAAADAETYENEDYEVEEPNMKFSHALIVVLALHIIAVGGVFAFNSIKAGHNPSSKSQTRDENPSSAQAAAEPKPSPARQAPEARPGKTYTVQAGDTLSRIAALYKTDVEAIENENGITSYSMIRVGQVLRIPAASTHKTESTKPPTDPITAAAKQAFLAARSDMADPPAPTAAKETVNPAPSIAARTEVAKAPSPAPHVETAKTHAVVAKPLPAVAATPKPATAQPSPKKVDEPAPASPDTYVVAKGDNPYSIAKKLHVSYNDLIAINDIKDPTRVQIGQKLKIPAKKN
jgi:peptidoglycan endopeptidase LytF